MAIAVRKDTARTYAPIQRVDPGLFAMRVNVYARWAMWEILMI